MPGHRLKRDPEQVKAAWQTAKSGRQFFVLLKTTYNIDAAHRLCAENGLVWPAPHWGTQLVDCPPRATAPVAEMTEADMVAHLEANGYALQRMAPEATDRHLRLETKTFSGTDFRIGVVSDTHLCSKYQQLTHLETAYDYFAAHEIDTVLHAGDLSAGDGTVYKGQKFELFLLGADEQADYIIANYPYREGVTTHAIAGNHDESHLKTAGLDLLKRVAEKRADIDYLGWYGAYVTIAGVRIYLHHGEGGLAYARSYKLQKYIEQFAPENKPNMLIEGHFHVTNVLDMYRNVNARLAGCFEAQTPFLKRKNVYPENGFYVLTVTADAEGLVKVISEFVPFYVPIDHDW